jgi:threonine dehydrogenase-like Zn-dependent dehydrogenase
MAKLDDYRNVSGPYAKPEASRAWKLYDAGLENLKLESATVPEPADDELLVRIDAVGICASDWKMISQGRDHSRMHGKDLATDPATPGHEVSLTVVRVGSALEGKYAVGDRCAVQADIYVHGETVAYGYKLPGADQQYQTIGPVIHEGGYLLKIDPSLGYSQAALAEPWACVFHAYDHHRETKGVLSGGTTWYVGAGPIGLMHIEKGIQDGPRRIVVTEMKDDRLEKVRRTLVPLAEAKGIGIQVVDLKEESVADVLEPHSVSDVLILCPVAKAFEEALEYLARGGFLNMFAGFPDRERAWVRLNLNDMHYGDWTILATSGSPIEALRRALDEAALGSIDPNNAVACVGGMDAVRDGIRHTHEGTYPGRIVIYPHFDMPLTPVEELTPDGRWTKEAEAQLLEEKLP